MKRAEGVVEILEAFDLGASHVARYVRLRAAGRVLTERAARDRLIDGFLAKVEEWLERSKGKVRPDVVHDKLRALGFAGSERTTRRAVARAKQAYAGGHRRVYRPRRATSSTAGAGCRHGSTRSSRRPSTRTSGGSCIGCGCACPRGRPGHPRPGP